MTNRPRRGLPPRPCDSSTKPQPGTGPPHYEFSWKMGGGVPGSASEVTLRGASRRALLTSLSFFGPVGIAVSEVKHQPPSLMLLRRASKANDVCFHRHDTLTCVCNPCLLRSQPRGCTSGDVKVGPWRDSHFCALHRQRGHSPICAPRPDPGFPKGGHQMPRCPCFGVSNSSETLDTLVTDITESQKWKRTCRREDMTRDFGPGTWDLA